MSTRGCDSAGEPTPAQARSARSLGITWWAFYIAGPGALHNWSDKGTTVIKDAGLLPLPIYVPRMGNGLIASRTPEVDAETFVAAYHSRGIDGAGVLDTEASMRDDPWTAQYERRFSAKMMLLRQAPITYAGGFSMQAPPSAPYKWWLVASTSPGTDEAFQEGQGDLAGIAVDFDYAGAQFPFAHFGFKPHPKLTPEVEEMFVRNPDTGEICLCGPSGAVNLGNDWTAVEAAYGAAGVPLVVVESASLQAAFLHIASHGPA